MQGRIRWLLLGVFLLAGRGLAAEPEGPCRVLFLGNSVFYFQGGVYQTFEALGEEQNVDLQAVSQRQAPEHTHGVEFLGLGRIPLSLPEVAADARIHTLIDEGNFQYVILEARREGYLMPDWVTHPEALALGPSLPYKKNFEALESLHRTIVRSGAKTVLYMHPGHHTLVDWKLPVATLYTRLRDDLQQVEVDGAHHPVILVPASLLWLDAQQRFGIDAWYSNSNHGTALARFASGCLIAVYLTGADPRSCRLRELPRDWTTAPDGPTSQIEDETVQWIFNQIWLYYCSQCR